MNGRRWHALMSAVGMLSMAGCSTAPTNLLAPSPSVPYERSSVLSKLGYTETIVAADRYRITVGGRMTTPKERLEKIATVRAAELGIEQRMKGFKIESMTLSETCSPATAGGSKSASTLEVRTRLLTAEVVYAKTPTDATFSLSKKTFEELRPTLDTDVVVPEAPTSPPAPCI